MRRDDACLLDMLLAARDALGFVSGLTFASRTCFRTRVRAPRKAGCWDGGANRARPAAGSGRSASVRGTPGLPASGCHARSEWT